MHEISQVRQFIVDRFLFGEEDCLSLDTSFLSNYIIDSLGIMELIAFLESCYGIIIEDHEITPENLDSLNKISAYLQRKLS